MKDRFRLLVDDCGNILDLELLEPARLKMLGSGGATRELGVLKQLDAGRKRLPVLLGSGLGHLLEPLRQMLDSGFIPVLIVVDKEADMRAALGLDLDHAKIILIDDADPDTALHKLTAAQNQYDGLPFQPLVHPFYQRLDKDYYGGLRDKLTASRQFDFWGRARQPRFATEQTRLLLITSRYFLIGEVMDACSRLGVEFRTITLEDDEMSSSDFVTQLLEAAVDFKPDAVLTLNHLGVDREGILTDLLARLELPLASWFVDNPHLVLHLYQGLSSPWLTIFTWDKDNIPSLKAQGFSNVFHLPLGTAPERFRPAPGQKYQGLSAELAFVGNSMVYKVEKRMEKARLPGNLLANYQQVAADFSASPERSIHDFVLTYSDELKNSYAALPDQEARLAYETMLTWEATRQYRTACVAKLLDVDPAMTPLIIGDDGWQIVFKDEKRPWAWHAPLAYYNELPYFYPHCTINFNTTSMQMKGAVNQRVFDVPAAGAFVLTDWREQMDELLEPGQEIISYKDIDEIPELARFYLKHEAERQAIIQAGRKRVLACHTWDRRVQSLIADLRAVYRK